MLHLLGDQYDKSYPIYHDDASHAHGDRSDWTMCTALFDLHAKTLAVYQGNPRMRNVAYNMSLEE